MEDLKHPDNALEERLYEIMFERDRDLNVGLFAVKPTVYEFEHEVRAILYPERDVFAPLEVAYPNISGFSLPLDPSVKGPKSINDFIDSVYVHPLLEADSLIARVITEINQRFGVPGIRLVADKIEALGNNVTLPC